MKKLYALFFFVIAATLCFAQAPQAFNYQAVVYDNSGLPLDNHNISLRISILDNSATGPVLYSETFTTTTDGTGMFSVEIGNGNVISGAFQSIRWPKGAKWQKTEIDITGGSSYILMGTSRYLNVPYAIYASQSNMGTIDYPDGIDPLTPLILLPGSYTVPPGKNFYITATDSNIVTVDSDLWKVHESLARGHKLIPLAVSENITIQSTGKIAGFLVEKIVTWITQDISVSSFTVPAGKQFFLARAFFNSSTQISIDGNSMNMNFEYFIANENQVISTTVTGPVVIVGYLRDK